MIDLIKEVFDFQMVEKKLLSNFIYHCSQILLIREN